MLQSHPAPAAGLIPVAVTLESHRLESEVSRCSAERDHEWLRQAIRLAHGDLTSDGRIHEIVLAELLQCLSGEDSAPNRGERAAERIGYLLWLALDEASWADATEITLAVTCPGESGGDLEIALSVS